MAENDDDLGGVDPLRILIFGCGFELAMAVVAIVLGWFNDVDPRALIPAASQWRAIGMGCFWGILAAIPWIFVLFVFEKMPWRWVRDHFDTSVNLLKYLAPLGTAELAVFATSAGVGEELLFRGWLQMSISGPIQVWSFGGLAVAVLISSIGFGLVHAISRAYIVFAFLMSVYLGVLLVWSGNLLTPIVAHSVYDFVAMLMLRAQFSNSSQEKL